MLDKYLLGLHWFFHLVVISGVILVFWLGITILAPKILPTQAIHNEHKWGVIWRNERWSGEVRVVGDLWALPGTTIVIDPGTRVLVETNGDRFNLHWTPWGLKSGLNSGEDSFGVKNGELFWDESQKIQVRLAKVFAMGTPQLPVIFQSTESRPGSAYGFNVLSIDSGVISYAQLANYRRFLVGNDVTIRDSQFNQIVECAICIEYSSPTIVNNEFISSLRQHLYIIGGSPKISDNLFSTGPCQDRCSLLKTPLTGIVLDPQGYGSAQIRFNDFEMGSGVGIEVVTGSEESSVGEISHNKFLGNSLVEIPCDSKIKIVNNQLRGGIRLKHSGNCVGKLVIDPNYWWLQDKDSVLSQRIIDKEPQFNIEIPQILNEPPPSGRR